MIGTTLNQRFRIDSILGRGGMGCVYRATDLVLKREVAIKTIDLATQAVWAERLRLEAEIVARLSHDHVVRLYDMGQIPDGPLYLVMELVEGSTLLRKFPDLTLDEKVRLLAETAEALDEAHQLGIVHRDIKPGNILLTKDLRAKLTDFGLALQQGDTVEENALRGTVPYMAPELFRNKPPSPSSDLYALGVVLYEAVTGELPFRGATREIVAEVTSRAPKSPRSINPAIPVELDKLIRQLLEKDPVKRPHRAAEVARKLEEIRHLLPGQTTPSKRFAQTPEPTYSEPSLADFARTMREELASGGVADSPGIFTSQTTSKTTQKHAQRPPIDIISEPLVRELVRIIEDEPMALDPTERSLAGGWLADMIMDQPRSWALSGGGSVRNESAELARALLALTSSVVAGGSEPSIARAGILIERGYEVRQGLSPLILGRYLAIRETTPGLELLRKIRKELVVNYEVVADTWMDDQGHLLPNRLPRDWENLFDTDSDTPKVSRDRLRLWNRLADIWASNPDFRRAVLRASAPWVAKDPAAMRFWPEVVEPLWLEARRRRDDPSWGRRLALLTPGARERMEFEARILETPRVKGRAATGSGISMAVAPSAAGDFAPLAPEFQSQPDIVTLIEEKPDIIKLGPLKTAYDEATSNYRLSKAASATHQRLPLGEFAHVVLMVSTRGGFKASQARILGKGLTPVEITIPPLQMSGSADAPIIAAWGYTDGSLAIKHRDQNRNEKSLAWSAPRKKWFHSDADRGLAELLKDLSLDIPIGTATALEAEKLWNKARKWFGSKSSESDEEEFDEDEIE